MSRGRRRAGTAGGGGSRLVPVSPPYSPELERTLRRMTPPEHEPLQLFRVLAHNPAFLDAFRHFGTYLLNFGVIDPEDREIVIQRTTARCGADYEWAVHAHFYGARVGLSEDQLDATLQTDAKDSGAFSARQRLLIRLVDELHETNGVSDALWRDLHHEWSAAQRVELVGLVGQYHLVAFLVNALGVSNEPYAPGLPPRPEGDRPRDCTEITIERAGAADLPAVVAIYNDAIPGRRATADLKAVSVDARRAWFERHGPCRPLWTARAGQEVVGWLSFEDFYGRAAYHRTAEVSLYVAPDHQRRGIATKLLEAAVSRAPDLGLAVLVGFIFGHNEASLRLFAGHGFRPCGKLSEVADLDGMLRDLVIVSRNV